MVKDLKHQNHDLLVQNEETHLKLGELQLQNETTTSQLDEIKNKLHITTKEFVPQLQDESKKETLVLLRSTVTTGLYYVMRRQLKNIDAFLKIKQDQGYKEIYR